MRKCPFFRNEDLYYLYRKKVGTHLSHVTGAHLAKCAFILSRSQFPFEELLYRQLFSAKALERGLILTNEGIAGALTQMAKRQTSFEIGSIVPSLAKSRFR
jgi:hypothetical protein